MILFSEDGLDIIEASYNDDVAPNAKGNPFIESLPVFSEPNEIAKRLKLKPDYDESWRQLPDHQRLQMLPIVKEFYFPLSRDIDNVQRIQSEINSVYLGRARSDSGYFKKLITGQDIYSIGSNAYRPAPMAVIGKSGIGKTSAVQRWKSLYPIAIRHSNYKGISFCTTQVPWVHVNCPADGSSKSLGDEFFSYLDVILGTQYSSKFKRGTANEKLDNMARIGAIHGVAVLSIDNTENLAGVNNLQKQQLLNFIYNLVEKMRVLILFVGTGDCLEFIAGDIRKARRLTEGGISEWDYLPDQDWNRYLKAMWKMQYTQDETVLTTAIAQKMRELSWGLPGIAAPLYILVQQRAINVRSYYKHECITVDLIDSVYKDHFTVLEKQIECEEARQLKCLLKKSQKNTPLHKTTGVSELASEELETEILAKPKKLVKNSKLLAACEAKNENESNYDILKKLGFIDSN
ncbi:TniB family NTP-binding protein [Neptunomonas sp.]|uniref:TniB family NTP-binding protein n=1 Tax=Neptunomonas sp. TaxID=1971898 RepID=UPI003566637C